MWNVVGPFVVGSPADSVVASEVVQSQNRRCLFLSKEHSELQIVATIVADSVVVVEEGMEDEVEVEAEVSVAAEEASVEAAKTSGVVGVAEGTAEEDSGVYRVLYRIYPELTMLKVVAGVEVLDIKAEEASVSTQTVDPGGLRTDLVGMGLQELDTEVVVMGAVVEDSVHLEVGMEVGTVPTLNGRAQGWTRIAIQSDQGIDSYS
jgi:hypothetical protein